MESNVRFYIRHGYEILETVQYSDKITLVRMGKQALPAT